MLRLMRALLFISFWALGSGGVWFMAGFSIGLKEHVAATIRAAPYTFFFARLLVVGLVVAVSTGLYQVSHSLISKVLPHFSVTSKWPLLAGLLLLEGIFFIIKHMLDWLA